mmetsp:Transcript_52198/g.144513  ORF Transcript_52198/g.144513 Transcript_52198/m.144513 type:complete len:318 (+) Transcript_52198:100-1053(+)
MGHVSDLFEVLPKHLGGEAYGQPEDADLRALLAVPIELDAQLRSLQPSAVESESGLGIVRRVEADLTRGVRRADLAEPNLAGPLEVVLEVLPIGPPGHVANLELQAVLGLRVVDDRELHAAKLRAVHLPSLDGRLGILHAHHCKHGRLDRLWLCSGADLRLLLGLLDLLLFRRCRALRNLCPRHQRFASGSFLDSERYRATELKPLRPELRREPCFDAIPLGHHGAFHNVQRRLFQGLFRDRATVHLVRIGLSLLCLLYLLNPRGVGLRWVCAELNRVSDLCTFRHHCLRHLNVGTIDRKGLGALDDKLLGVLCGPL